MPPIERVVVHPLVLLSVVDHYNRLAKVGNINRVVGVLLGSQRAGVLGISNSFAVPFDEDARDNSVWFLDHDYLEVMYGMFKKVNARERIVGWYHTGPKLHANDIAISDLIKKHAPNAVLVIIDVKPKALGLPTDAYIEVDEVHDDGTPTTKTFQHVVSEMGAEEAEEVGVEHLLRDIKDSSAGTLSQRITNQLGGLRGLIVKLEEIHSYLNKVVSNELPINYQVVYLLQDIFNLLPDVSLQSFVKSVYMKTNDQMLVVYIASLVRAILALHDLIRNKVSMRESELETNAAGDAKKADKESKDKDKTKEKEKVEKKDSKAESDKKTADKKSTGSPKK